MSVSAMPKRASVARKIFDNSDFFGDILNQCTAPKRPKASVKGQNVGSKRSGVDCSMDFSKEEKVSPSKSLSYRTLSKRIRTSSPVDLNPPKKQRSTGSENGKRTKLSPKAEVIDLTKVSNKRLCQELESENPSVKAKREERCCKKTSSKESNTSTRHCNYLTKRRRSHSARTYFTPTKNNYADQVKTEPQPLPKETYPSKEKIDIIKKEIIDHIDKGTNFFSMRLRSHCQRGSCSNACKDIQIKDELSPESSKNGVKSNHYALSSMNNSMKGSSHERCDSNKLVDIKSVVKVKEGESKAFQSKLSQYCEMTSREYYPLKSVSSTISRYTNLSSKNRTSQVDWKKINEKYENLSIEDALRLLYKPKLYSTDDSLEFGKTKYYSDSAESKAMSLLRIPTLFDSEETIEIKSLVLKPLKLKMKFPVEGIQPSQPNRSKVETPKSASTDSNRSKREEAYWNRHSKRVTKSFNSVMKIMEMKSLQYKTAREKKLQESIQNAATLKSISEPSHHSFQSEKRHQGFLENNTSRASPHTVGNIKAERSSAYLTQDHANAPVDKLSFEKCSQRDARQISLTQQVAQSKLKGHRPPFSKPRHSHSSAKDRADGNSSILKTDSETKNRSTLAADVKNKSPPNRAICHGKTDIAPRDKNRSVQYNRKDSVTSPGQNVVFPGTMNHLLSTQNHRKSSSSDLVNHVKQKAAYPKKVNCCQSTNSFKSPLKVKDKDELYLPQSPFKKCLPPGINATEELPPKSKDFKPKISSTGDERLFRRPNDISKPVSYALSSGKITLQSVKPNSKPLIRSVSSQHLNIKDSSYKNKEKQSGVVEPLKRSVSHQYLGSRPSNESLFGSPLKLQSRAGSTSKANHPAKPSIVQASSHSLAIPPLISNKRSSTDSLQTPAATPTGTQPPKQKQSNPPPKRLSFPSSSTKKLKAFMESNTPIFPSSKNKPKPPPFPPKKYLSLKSKPEAKQQHIMNKPNTPINPQYFFKVQIPSFKSSKATPKGSFLAQVERLSDSEDDESSISEEIIVPRLEPLPMLIPHLPPTPRRQEPIEIPSSDSSSSSDDSSSSDSSSSDDEDSSCSPDSSSSDSSSDSE